MGVKIKSMKNEDFNDNETLESLNELGNNVFLTTIDNVLNWGRSNSIWPLTFATSCCGIEMMAAGAPRYDFARFGIEVYRATPRQADVIVVAGTIVHKMVPILKRLYNQMAEPKYVIAMGACAVSGGPFFYNNYSVVRGRCVCSGLSSPTRSLALWGDAASAQDKNKISCRKEK